MFSPSYRIVTKVVLISAANWQTYSDLLQNWYCDWKNREQVLRSFGRCRAIGDEAVHSLDKRNGSGEEFDADEIAISVDGGRLAQMPDLGVGQGRLPVQDQAHPLNGFDGERLVRLDQRAMVRNIAQLNRVPGVEGSPEGPEDLKTNPGPAITRCSHH